MEYKKTVSTCASLFFIISLFISYAAADPLDDIKDQLCPDGKVKMEKILKKDSKLRWKDKNKPLVFSGNKNRFKKFNCSISDADARNYMLKSLCMLPPKAVTAKFLDGYCKGVTITKPIKGETSDMTAARVFKKLAECCSPAVDTALIPNNLAEINELLTAPYDLATPVPDSELAP